MRESIGATWIFGIVIFFVILFTAFLAFSINFAKAYTVKDEIIDELEKYNGPGKTSSGGYSSDALKAIDEYLHQVNYGSKGNCYSVVTYLYSGQATTSGLKSRSMGVLNKNGYVWSRNESSFPKGKYSYCIIRENQTFTGGTNDQVNIGFATYKVITFFSVNINIIAIFGSYFVSGETKNITYPTDSFLS